jgi:DNA-binding response OmpR family regulator
MGRTSPPAPLDTQGFTAAEQAPGEAAPCLMIVEPDPDTAQALGALLRDSGFAVQLAESIAAARAGNVEAARIALVGLNLPDGSGLLLLRDIAGRRDRGAILLCPEHLEAERVAGLELGADDVLAPPYPRRETVARIRALLRRLEEPEAAIPTLKAAEVLLDPQRQRILARDGREHRLTGAEAGLLEIMLSAPDHVAERSLVARRVLGYALQPQQRGVDQFASSLRQKLQRASGGRIRVTAVRGRGYRLVW